MDAHGRGERHDRTEPLERPGKSTTSFARLVAEMALLTSRPGRCRGGVSASYATRGGGQGARGSTRSGSDPQFYQPFELADFLTKATHLGAVSCFQPHGGGEVAVPDGPVPVPVLGLPACLGARPDGRRLAGGDHLGFEIGQPRLARDDFRYQHLAVEYVRQSRMHGAGRGDACRLNIDGGRDAAPPSGKRGVMTVSRE